MGVLLSAARVQEEAYATGIAKRGVKLTEAQKVEARMNIILADSVAMHGDLINTQESAANTARALGNSVTDLGTNLGIKLLPTFQLVIGALSTVVDFMTRNIDVIIPSRLRWSRVGRHISFTPRRQRAAKLAQIATEISP